jgi:hypothetical protein
VIDSLGRKKTIEISWSLAGCCRHVDVALLFVVRERPDEYADARVLEEKPGCW